jgi:glycosyltransferase involved in cell wall biosynthesis
MHIAHFIQRYPPALGGSEAYFQRLGRHWLTHGHRVTVWTTNAIDLAAFWSPTGRCVPTGVTMEDDIEVRRFSLWRMKGRRWLLKPLSLVPIRAWQAMTLPCNPISLKMWRAAGEESQKYDAVHATAFPYAWPIACAARLAKRQRIPFFLTPFLHIGAPDDPHDRARKQYTQPALRRLLRMANGIFVQTEMERAAAIDLGVPSERVILQGLGVDILECTEGDRKRARQEWGLDEYNVVIGHLANLSAEKGSIDLVRATSSLADKRVVLVLAGPAMPNFERVMTRFEPSVRIIRTGILSEQAKRDFYAGIDMFALPSRSDSFGLVILEAWANGVPVVVARAGGPGEIVRHGIDGLLAKPGDLAGFAELLTNLVCDKDQRFRLGEAGRQRCANEFQWESKLRIVHETIQEECRHPWSAARPYLSRPIAPRAI